MMPGNYVAKDGSEKFSTWMQWSVSWKDLARSVRLGVARGYALPQDVFIELRSSPPDIRGNSQDEAEEMSPADIAAAYGVSETTCMQMRKNPRGWSLIDLCGSATAAPEKRS